MKTMPSRPDDVPGALWPLIDACLAKDPAQRPAATELAATLRDFQYLGAFHGPAGFSGDRSAIRRQDDLVGALDADARGVAASARRLSPRRPLVLACIGGGLAVLAAAGAITATMLHSPGSYG